MRCRFALRVIEYTATFDQPIFSLAQRQTDVLEACFRKVAQSYPLDLGDLRAPGGETYADLVVTVRYPRLRGGVEVRVNRLTGRFEGLVSEEDADQSMLFVSKCEEAIQEVFPDIVVASTSTNIMSWLTCDGEKRNVEELLSLRQQVQFDPSAVGGEKARFFVRGQILNEAEEWSLAFGLEPSVLPEYGLYLNCQGNYGAASRYGEIGAQAIHLRAVVEGILSQFGFEVTAEHG